MEDTWRFTGSPPTQHSAHRLFLFLCLFVYFDLIAKEELVDGRDTRLEMLLVFAVMDLETKQVNWRDLMHVMTQCNFDDFKVRDCQPNSHARKGWERFTDAAIRTVSQQRSGVVFVLWGNAAQEKMRLINTNVHHILKAAHPSGLSANRGFFGCRHFTKTNRMLEKAGYLPINWKL